jgi:hypothetical protein
MTDEAAVLLRISVFGFVAGVIYWSLSYELLGTAGFLLLGAGPGFAGLYLLATQDTPPESLWDRLRRLAGVPRPDPATPTTWRRRTWGSCPAPRSGRSPSPSASPWPPPAPVVGFWSLLLGLGLIALAAIGWQAAVNREQRHGRLERPRRDQDGQDGRRPGP